MAYDSLPICSACGGLLTFDRDTEAWKCRKCLQGD